jgi:hypothetical protein
MTSAAETEKRELRVRHPVPSSSADVKMEEDESDLQPEEILVICGRDGPCIEGVMHVTSQKITCSCGCDEEYEHHRVVVPMLLRMQCNVAPVNMLGAGTARQHLSGMLDC